jgi:hypothetical protein
MSFLAWIRKIHHALHECAESIRNANRRKKEHRLPSDKPIEVCAVVSYDKDTIAQVKADNERNHTTQESIKKATWAAVVAASIYALISLLMWHQMVKQTKMSHTQLIVSQRPWVGIYQPIIKLTQDRWFIDFQLKNFGNSPSLYTAAGANPAYPPIDEAGVRNMIEQDCKVADNISAAPDHAERHGYTVFPGEPVTYEPGQTIDKSRQSTVYLVGCIAYLDQFTDAQRGPLHHTRFCYYADAPLADGEKLSNCFGGQEAGDEQKEN